MSMVEENREDVGIRSPHYSILVSNGGGMMEVQHHPSISLLLVAVDRGDLTHLNLEQRDITLYFLFQEMYT